MTADQKLCTALTVAKINTPEITALLHSAYHDGHYLPDGFAAQRIKDARESLERLLVAVLAAEQAVASTTPAAPAINVLEPFPGNGAYSA